ncbi:hypothetical protein [Microvirga arabica]|uniref:hypothetical protein n=1 Tax=Microvirga arabica TaxID=1128671 RepID=UPI0019392F92|nr:hypothetical protein [Microvirga arabica]MBM1172840.1 hypothetical protein [Microvirga arabica]
MRKTDHLQVRVKQRGFRSGDDDLILTLGIESFGTGYFLRSKDVEEAIRALKETIVRLERLKGTLLVSERGVMKTIYRPSRHRERRVLQQAST